MVLGTNIVRKELGLPEAECWRPIPDTRWRRGSRIARNTSVAASSHRRGAAQPQLAGADVVTLLHGGVLCRDVKGRGRRCSGELS